MEKAQRYNGSLKFCIMRSDLLLVHSASAPALTYRPKTIELLAIGPIDQLARILKRAVDKIRDVAAENV